MFRMKHAHRGLLAATPIALSLLALGTSGATSASAAIAPNGHAEITALNQVQYTGLAGVNNVTVSLSGNRLVIKDIAPITVGPGCFDSGTDGSLFVVSCTTPVAPNGQPMAFRVDAGAGHDVVTNNTAIGMRADGGLGNDRLNGGSGSDLLDDDLGTNVLAGNAGADTLETDFGGGDGMPDVLSGGTGDDDLQAGPTSDTLQGGGGQDVLRGGAGADTLDGGTGSGDTVTYLDNAHNGVRVVLSLDGLANDGIFTPGSGSAEKDNVLDSNEIVAGGNGNDTITGDERANHLVGNVGNDTLVGAGGADLLDGGAGDDTIAGNQLFGVPVADGAIDTLNGNSGTADYCRIPFAEADITIGCETIDQD
jgi:Ca2+-binding RTX toxin-like protein